MSLNNGGNTSADVYYAEHDNSIRGEAVSPSTGAIVGASHRGPVGVRTLVTSKAKFRTQFGVPDFKLTFAHVCAEHFFSEGNQLYFTRIAVASLYGSAKVGYIDNFSVGVPSVAGIEEPQEVVMNETDLLLIHGANQGAWNNDISVLMYPDAFDPDNEMFVVEVFYGNSSVPVETFRCTLRDKVDGYGRQQGIEDVLEASDYIRVVVNRDHVEFTNFPKRRFINTVVRVELANGHNGDAVTIDNVIDAWELYDDTEEVQVSILINAGYSHPAVHQKMLQVAEQRGDAFAILDLPSDKQTSQRAVEYRRNILNANSTFGALYGPDVNVRTDDDISLFVPCSGYIAAAYCRNDRNAAEWFAPAGVTRGGIPADGVRHTYLLGDRNMLAANQVNYIHNLAGHGLVIWSQDTLQGFKSALSNIHVRRLLNTLQTSIRYASMVSLFEPNDPILRTELRAVARDILEPIKRGRGLYGYDIICDETNNTPELQDAGDTVLDVYIDPMMTTKRIHLTANVVRRGQVEFAVTLLNRD